MLRAIVCVCVLGAGVCAGPAQCCCKMKSCEIDEKTFGVAVETFRGKCCKLSKSCGGGLKLLRSSPPPQAEGDAAGLCRARSCEQACKNGARAKKAGVYLAGQFDKSLTFEALCGKCDCDAVGATGNLCETCKPCQNGSKRSPGAPGCQCDCPAGKSGVLCNVDSSKTATGTAGTPPTCKNGGWRGDGDQCHCPPNTTGADCGQCAEGFTEAGGSCQHGAVMSVIAGAEAMDVAKVQGAAPEVIELVHKKVPGIHSQLKEIDPDNKASVFVFGDVHGQLWSTIPMMNMVSSKAKAVCNGCELVPGSQFLPCGDQVHYLFLGDYVDRGDRQVEVLVYLLALREACPGSFTFLRGNHEFPDTNERYGFIDVVKELYGEERGDALWKNANEIFVESMTVAARIKSRVLGVHGGMASAFRSADEWKKVGDLDCDVEDEVDFFRSPCMLTWSDPDPEVKRFAESERGMEAFGKAPFNAFMDRSGADVMLRAHDVRDGVMIRGFEPLWGTRTSPRLITLFSAPNYLGTEKTLNQFDEEPLMNPGAVMVLHPTQEYFEGDYVAVRWRYPTFDITGLNLGVAEARADSVRMGCGDCSVGAAKMRGELRSESKKREFDKRMSR